MDTYPPENSIRSWYYRNHRNCTNWSYFYNTCAIKRRKTKCFIGQLINIHYVCFLLPSSSSVRPLMISDHSYLCISSVEDAVPEGEEPIQWAANWRIKWIVCACEDEWVVFFPLCKQILNWPYFKEAFTDDHPHSLTILLLRELDFYSELVQDQFICFDWSEKSIIWWDLGLIESEIYETKSEGVMDPPTTMATVEKKVKCCSRAI